MSADCAAAELCHTSAVKTFSIAIYPYTGV